MFPSYTRPDRPRVCALTRAYWSVAWARRQDREPGGSHGCASGVGALPQRGPGGGLGSGAALSDQPFQHRCRVYRFAGRPFGRRNGEAVDRLPAEPIITLREAVKPVTAACRAVVFPELEGLIVVHQQHGRHPGMAGKGLSLRGQPERKQAGTRERAASGQRARRVRHIGHV